MSLPFVYSEFVVAWYYFGAFIGTAEYVLEDATGWEYLVRC